MKYPEWAPQVLVEKHKKPMANESSEKGGEVIEPELIITEGICRHNSLSAEYVEDISKSLNGQGFTNLSNKESKALYQKITNTADELLRLMDKADKFNYYSISQLINNEYIDELKEYFNIQSDIGGDDSYLRICLFRMMPKITDVLADISDKSALYKNEILPITKPNDENADIHYFIRSLSQYLKKNYNQPLHEVVALTTDVIFDRQNPVINSDYVRMIIRRK